MDKPKELSIDSITKSERLNRSQTTATASDVRNMQEPKSIEDNDYMRMYELQHSLKRNPDEFVPATAAAADAESILLLPMNPNRSSLQHRQQQQLHEELIVVVNNSCMDKPKEVFIDSITE